MLGRHLAPLLVCSAALLSACGIGDVSGDSGHTPLGIAAGQCSVDRAAEMIDRGADPNEMHPTGGTAFHAAARSGGSCHVEMFEMLEAAGADPTISTPAGDNALVLVVAVLASTDDLTVDAAKWLVGHGVDPCVAPVAYTNNGAAIANLLVLVARGRRGSPLLVNYLAELLDARC